MPGRLSARLNFLHGRVSARQLSAASMHGRQEQVQTWGSSGWLARVNDMWNAMDKDETGRINLATLKKFYRARVAKARKATKTETHFRGFHVRKDDEQIAVKFTELGLRLPSGGFVLKGVTGEIEPSSLVAVMGPSGAGKTSFMNAISGRAYYAKRTGTMLVNDRNIEIPELGGHVGFVPQDDVVHDVLTVYEVRFGGRRGRGVRP